MDEKVHKPKYSLPCLLPEVLQPGLFTWACRAKSGKKIQSQTYNANPKSLKKPKAQSSGF